MTDLHTPPPDLHTPPPGLPRPVDDGAAAHLPGRRLPCVPLASTEGGTVDLSAIAGRVVVYCYPMTGRPDVALPEGWDTIPGARGCTPQSCSWRDHHAELKALGAEVFGLSTQASDYQREMVERLHLPFAVLSDVGGDFRRALELPTFEAAGMTLLKRLTFIVRDGVIEDVLYPVFPSDADVAWVMERLRASR
ncbi:peroxiredoxin [Breoghania corrubedonensis]|uniref:Peroxiredoxin n=1 Tax=Breoghania corrubedonensis TaxID=665038 RepID=A0A2T5V8L7_9HYPH|nr:peroxiredoxin [Breoghania corrubedonensis]PTW60074.1 peroxiredoxin [Breoghania corrubedonensis]